MVSPEPPPSAQPTPSKSSMEPVMSSPRISFSADFLDDDSFISISPDSLLDKEITISHTDQIDRSPKNVVDFEFLSDHISTPATMITADELFFEGKLLPYWQAHQAERLSKLGLKSNSNTDQPGAGGYHQKDQEQQQTKGVPTITAALSKEEPRIWYIDDDPSPRPPKCTVLWKELLRLKKQRSSSTLSPSSSSSSTSSSSSSLGDAAAMEDGEKEGGGEQSFKEKQIKRIKKGLERTRSATIRIRPMVNVPICQTQGKTTSLPPLFPTKIKRSGRPVERKRVDRRSMNIIEGKEHRAR